MAAKSTAKGGRVTSILRNLRRLLREIAAQAAREWALLTTTTVLVGAADAGQPELPGGGRRLVLGRTSVTTAGLTAVSAYRGGLLRLDRRNPVARRHAIQLAAEYVWRHTACGVPAIMLDMADGDWRELPAARQCRACHAAVSGG
jgi:hypothetical protein